MKKRCTGEQIIKAIKERGAGAKCRQHLPQPWHLKWNFLQLVQQVCRAPPVSVEINAFADPIDEHDFHGRRCLDEDGQPIFIQLETVLTDLTQNLVTKYRGNREYWDSETDTLLDETAGVEDTENETGLPTIYRQFRASF